jgi:hypothetical protein
MIEFDEWLAGAVAYGRRKRHPEEDSGLRAADFIEGARWQFERDRLQLESEREKTEGAFERIRELEARLAQRDEDYQCAINIINNEAPTFRESELITENIDIRKELGKISQINLFLNQEITRLQFELTDSKSAFNKYIEEAQGRLGS